MSKPVQNAKVIELTNLYVNALMVILKDTKKIVLNVLINVKHVSINQKNVLIVLNSESKTSQHVIVKMVTMKSKKNVKNVMSNVKLVSMKLIHVYFAVEI